MNTDTTIIVVPIIAAMIIGLTALLAPSLAEVVKWWLNQPKKNKTQTVEKSLTRRLATTFVKIFAPPRFSVLFLILSVISFPIYISYRPEVSPMSVLTISAFCCSVTFHILLIVIDRIVRRIIEVQAHIIKVTKETVDTLQLLKQLIDSN